MFELSKCLYLYLSGNANMGILVSEIHLTVLTFPNKPNLIQFSFSLILRELNSILCYT